MLRNCILFDYHCNKYLNLHKISHMGQRFFSVLVITQLHEKNHYLYLIVIVF